MNFFRCVEINKQQAALIVKGAVANNHKSPSLPGFPTAILMGRSAAVKTPLPAKLFTKIMSATLPTVLIRPGEADRVVGGHPWIYQGSVLRLTQPATDGELVQVKDHRQRFLGVG